MLLWYLLVFISVLFLLYLSNLTYLFTINFVIIIYSTLVLNIYLFQFGSQGDIQICKQKFVFHLIFIFHLYFIYFILTLFKGLVHPKMKISPCFTHPQRILGVYDFLLSDESNRSYVKMILALPSVRMGVGGCSCSKAVKACLTRLRGVNKGLL